ncbi:hypothetical protein E1301_Tti008168 [Triplophysa tibetana]|uniref:DUF4585 domain-containing protein n=1 Tax=Triplophysa tibetana TaxID=1572043 RepID=A0A5A9PET8_9TELE|nr:hypothetical protein E1301_Tti008168 [Triplophysa tibetana]
MVFQYCCIKGFQTSIMEGHFPSDLLKEITKSSPSINEKVSQNIRQRDEGESDPEQADDIMDDSTSSYYNALCSLSEFGEDMDYRTHTLSTECLVEGELLDCTTSVEGITSKSTKTPMVQPIKDTFLSQDYKTQEELDTKLPNVSKQQYRKQEHSGTLPKEDLATQQPRPREGLSACLAESRFDRGGYIRGHVVNEGQGEGSCKKEQAELSLRSRNRKCLQTASQHSQPASKSHESRHTVIQSVSPQPGSNPRYRHLLVHRVWKSRPGTASGCPDHSPTNSLAARDNPATPQTIPQRTSSMGTKLAEASSKVGTLVNLAQVRSSCSEAEYLHVFSSTCRPSHQPSADASHNNWTDDVLSFKMQMYSKAQNKSAFSGSSCFECIDVAVETTEEINQGLKTVPKRQIQLKRRDTAESHTRENDNITRQLPQTPMRTRDIFQRQHSMPAAFHQESHMADQTSVQAERKQRLQKSFSLDETSSKTKMASCMLTSVLSKKMQHEQNLRSMDSTDASINVNSKTTNFCLHLSGKDAHAEMTKPKQSAFFQNASLNTECSSFQQYNIVNSKIQPRPFSKHSFNPLLTGIERSEFHGSSTEITVTSENEKEEKVIPREEATQLPNLSPGAMLSCDSAKERTWNLSAATSVAISPHPPVKTTPEECHMGQRIHKQPNVTQNLTHLLDKQELHGVSMESTLCPTNIACLISDLEANTMDAVPQDDEGGIKKEQESNKEQVKLTSLGVQGQRKLKAMAPVHVVRDMRSLVKNTYNLPFKGPAESTHEPSRSAPLFQQSLPNQNNNRDEEKGEEYRQDKKPVVRKVTPPLSLDKVRNMASHHAIPIGCSTKANPPAESKDKIHTVGFTKVSPTKANHCGMSKPPGTQSSQVRFCKGDVTSNDTNLKPTNRKDRPQQTKEEPTKGELNKAGQETDSDNDQPSKFHNVPVALPYYSPTVNVEQQDHAKMISNDHQTPCLPPRSQNSVGPLSSCVLTVASTPMLPSFYYNANPLGYQTISPQIGAVHGYVQGPLLFQTPLFNHPPASNSHSPLLGSLSEDGKMLGQQILTDSSTNHAEKEESMPFPEGIQNTIFVSPLSAEARLRGAGVLGPETGGSIAAGQHPCQLLLDPESGHCFYVEMTQLPQRKMLFDPQTCQFVEVLLPQQTLTSAILSPPCGIPFASLHIPPMYVPHYSPYVQTHPQVFQPPAP